MIRKFLQSKLGQHMRETYFAAVPTATFILYRGYISKAKYVYDSMLQMTDINDDAFKRLSELGFKIDDKHRELRSLQPRGKVCADVMDADSIRVDADIWINEQLRSIMPVFNNFDIYDQVSITSHYDVQRDAVLFRIAPIAAVYAEDCKAFLHVNAFVTGLFAGLAIAIGCIIAF